MDIEIYQIFFKEFQRQFIAQSFKPLENKIVDGFAEFGVFQRAFARGLIKPNTLTGLLSWKFERKSYISADELLKFIKSQPGADIYIINPFPELQHFHKNVWVQGGEYHPGFLPLAQELFNELGFKLDLQNMTHAQNHWSFCNYWVATDAYWKKYMAFANRFFDALNDPNSKSYNELRKSAHYHFGGSYLPFFFERLPSTYLTLHPETKVAQFPWTEERLFHMISSMRDDVNRARAQLDAPRTADWIERKYHRIKRALVGQKK